MGEVPFFDRFRTRRRDETAVAITPADLPPRETGLSPEAKLAIVEDLEESGLGWFWATDEAGRLAYLSPRLAEGFGKPITALLGMPLQALFAPDSSDQEVRSLNLKLGMRKPFANFVVEAVDHTDAAVLRLSGRPVHAADGSFAGFRGSAFDITDEYRHHQETARLSRHDTLTGLLNRHWMARLIDVTLSSFASAKRSCALFMIDLDRFKQVNDTLGHPAGDELLVQVARRIEGVIGTRGQIGRLGGDEFQILVPDMDDRGQLGEIAKKLISSLSQPYSLEDGRCTIGASVGMGISPYDGIDREALTRAADLALYAAKNGGRGQFRFYSADLELDDRLRRRMEEDLSGAIEAEQLVLEYQPVVAIGTSKVVALQVVYVWEDPERGRVTPETFLPIAEGSRLTVPIGEWALREACTAAAGWPAPVRLVFSATPVQFADRGFVPAVKAALDASGLPSERLQVEISEAVFAAGAEEVEATVSALFRLGVRLSLEDFGSGSVSLSYLRRAPFSAITIGQAFLQSNIGDAVGDMEMVKGIVQLAKVLRLETGAAKVDSLVLLEALKECGVDEAQGFVFADALPADEVAARIEGGGWSLSPDRDGSHRSGRRTVFRRVGLIHEDQYYDVTMRNLSRTGAMIEGLEDVPVGTQFVLDFGGGQLAVATVVRTDGDTQGLEFEHPLVDDGAGGLCTRARVSPYELAAAGAPLSALPAGRYPGAPAPSSGSGLSRFALSLNAPRQGTGPG